MFWRNWQRGQKQEYFNITSKLEIKDTPEKRINTTLRWISEEYQRTSLHGISEDDNKVLVETNINFPSKRVNRKETYLEK